MPDTTAPASPLFPIPPVDGSGWKPDYIYYSRFALHPDGTPYSATGTRRYALADVGTIEAFVLTASQGKIPYPYVPVTPTNPPPTTSTPLDVLASEPSWVVIELEDPARWRFSTKRAALTSKEDYGPTKNQGLFDIDPATQAPASPAQPYPPACSMLCFRVIQREPLEAEHFNLHVEQLVDGVWTAWNIDPDVPNDGGHVPLPGGAPGFKATHPAASAQEQP